MVWRHSDITLLEQAMKVSPEQKAIADDVRPFEGEWLDVNGLKGW